LSDGAKGRCASERSARKADAEKQEKGEGRAPTHPSTDRLHGRNKGQRSKIGAREEAAGEPCKRRKTMPKRKAAAILRLTRTTLNGAIANKKTGEDGEKSAQDRGKGNQAKLSSGHHQCGGRASDDST